MVGGPADGFALIEPFVRDLDREGRLGARRRSGSGHFVKMVHNGIEYGMMQALGEGFEIMRASEFELDLRQLADLWQHGSVVRGWLLELLERAFDEDPDLAAHQRLRRGLGRGPLDDPDGDRRERARRRRSRSRSSRASRRARTSRSRRR